MAGRRAFSSSPAALATLRDLEQRLKSIKNIQKITSTMKIVASTRLTKAQRAMRASRAYGQAGQQLYESAGTQAGDEGKSLVVVASSDKGLCGAVHSGLSRKVRPWLASRRESVDLVVLGDKAKAQLGRSSPRQMVLSFNQVAKDVPTFADAQAIADRIFSLGTEYSKIEVVYNRFKSAISYEPAVMEAFSEAAFRQSPNFNVFEIEDDVLTNLKEFALANTLLWALVEGHACEISARQNAMDNASKNAGDMIDRFSIIYNRTRQAVITNELVDIITGASAL